MRWWSCGEYLPLLQLLLFQGTVRMEHQNLINDHPNKIVSSGISGSDGHQDTMLDLRSLALGQLLWVRGFKCSWWPAQVVDEKNISENIIVNDRIEGGILVRFYGSYTYAWVDPFADLCKFRESFMENGSNHVKAFQKSLAEILLHNDVNKPSVQVDGMHHHSVTPSQCNMSGGEKSTSKVSMCKSVKGEEPEKGQRQGKQKEKVPKRGKVEEPEKIGRLAKRKEKTSKSIKGEEPEQIQTQGKRKAKVLKREKGQEPAQIESEEKKKEKAPKKARSEEPDQIQSKGKRKEKALNSTKDEEPMEIENQGKGKGKIPKNVTGREQEKIQSQGKRKENAIKCAKGEEPEQTQRKGKKKEKASSDVSQRSRGKTKEKVPSNAQEAMEDGSEKTVRQIRLMRQLGLAAPAGSPFSV